MSSVSPAARSMTTEQAVQHLKSQGAHAELVRDTYLDDDVVVAALRFSCSIEFQCVAEWARAAGFGATDSVLDLGAGRGVASLAWALRGYTVTALDPDPSPLVGRGALEELTQRTCVPIRVVDGTGESIPLPSNSLHIVYVRQTLHHAENLDVLCSEIARVLRPGGLLIATREHVVSNARQLEQFLASHPVHQLAGGEMAYTLPQYLTAFRKARLQRIRVLRVWDTPVNYFPYTSTYVHDLSTKFATRLLGRALGGQLSKFAPYHHLWSRLSSRRANGPGRMYSFMARKAEKP